MWAQLCVRMCRESQSGPRARHGPDRKLGRRLSQHPCFLALRSVAGAGFGDDDPAAAEGRIEGPIEVEACEDKVSGFHSRGRGHGRGPVDDNLSVGLDRNIFS